MISGWLNAAIATPGSWDACAIAAAHRRETLTTAIMVP
jgi:hypothetical protein